MSKAIEENKLTVLTKIIFYENPIYICNLCVQTKIMMRTKRTPSFHSSDRSFNC